MSYIFIAVTFQKWSNAGKMSDLIGAFVLSVQGVQRNQLRYKK